ncbi:ABC transporter substrate-binding protein [Enterococcus sp. 2201sp1_2201st1_B8_2201SCRN_220225]|uniref:taurine ABC transporter substrate-binding protein n=1 Tax=unclassified Enterococcus TaxID=2608891 RepID=UPI0034A2A189
MKKVMMIVATVLSGLVLASCGSKNQKATAEENQPKEVNIGIIRVPNDKQVAISENYFDEYFKDKGIQTNFTFFDSGVAANQAFASGSIDFAEMGYTNGVVALAKDLPVELIWIHDVLGTNEALVARNDSGITDIGDLKGKKIATPFSSTSHFSLLKALEEAGIADDVTLLDMQTADIVAAWERGDIDAAYTWEPTLTTLKESGTVLVDSKQLAEKGYMTTNIDLVRKEFSEKYPDLVVDYLAALSKGRELYTSQPEVAAEAVAKDLKLETAEALTQMKGSTWLTPEEQLSADYFGTAEKPGQFHQVFLDTAEFLKEQKSITVVPGEKQVHQFINSTYIEKLVAR